MRLATALLLTTSIIACTAPSGNEASTAGAGSATDGNLTETSPAGEEAPLVEDSTAVAYTWQLLSNENGTFGYDIYAQGRLYIHQTAMPGSPENKGFSSKVDAKRSAYAAIEELKQGRMPAGHTQASQQLQGPEGH